jgi:hypothetical protein
LIETETPVLFRNVCADQSQLGSLADQFPRKFPIVFLEFIDMGIHFIVNKLARRIGNHPMLFSEILRRKDLFRCAFFD